MKKLLVILFLLPIIFLSCEENVEIGDIKSTPTINDNSENSKDNLTRTPIIPEITWEIGISMLPWKPKYDCFNGIGICSINAIFVKFKWGEAERAVPIDLGVDKDNNEAHIVINDGTDITQYMGSSLTIETEDSDIDVDQSILNDIGVSDINLVAGTYSFFVNNDSNYEIIIPYTE